MQESKTFCILPFIHLYAEPKGEMKPCCISDRFDKSLNLKTLSIDEAFNSQQMKDLRKDMLEGIENKVCKICYNQEKYSNHSPRKNFNNDTAWELPKINEDYSVESQFQYIDIRFSNLCNFKCRMCFHDFSSNWYEDALLVRPDYKPESKILKITDTFSNDLKEHLSKIKSIYFAGGEPMIMPEHFNLLTYLYDNIELDKFTQKRNLTIHYNTNLSVIKYDEQSLIELWKGFKKVMLSISCDGIGEVGEYQRTGFSTTRFEENMKIIQRNATPINVFQSFTGIGYNFQYTVTIMNLYHIFDFIEYMMFKNYITDSEQIDFYVAQYPLEYSLSHLSDSEKEKSVEFLSKKVKYYSGKTQNELNRIIDFIKSDVEKYDYDVYPDKYIKKLDELRGGNFEEISKIIL